MYDYVIAPSPDLNRVNKKHISTRKYARLMTNPAQKYVFAIWHKHKAPSGRELSAKLTEGECVMMKFSKTIP